MGLTDLLSSKVTVERPSLSSVHAAFTTIATGLVCDIQSGRGRFVRDRMGERTDAGYMGVFQTSADVREGDVVTDAAGVKYEVRFVDTIRGHHKEAMLERKLG